MSKIFICLDGSFPRGDPGANRIYYLAKAIQCYKINVIVISSCKNESQKEGWYNNVQFLNWIMYKNNIFKYIQKKILSGFLTINILKKISIKSEDTVIIYGSNSLFTRVICNFCKKMKIKTVLDIVEWHQVFEYNWGYLNFRFLSACDNFYNVSKKVNKVIAISSIIAKYFEKKKINVKIIPPLTDVNECKFVKRNNNKEYIDIIYPGNPFGKDNIKQMIQCLLNLPENYRNKIKFHMTGISRKQLEQYLRKDRYLLKKINDNILFHGWLEYSDLCNLFQTIDYFYIYRNNNKLTEANFPSKLPELLGYGIIPICNCIGDYTTFLQDGVNALFFDENNKNEILIKAIDMAIVKREEMRYNARLCAEKKFDINNWGKSILEIIK